MAGPNVTVRSSRASLALSSTMSTSNCARTTPAGMATAAGAVKSAPMPPLPADALPPNASGTLMPPAEGPDRVTVNRAAPASSATTPPPDRVTVTGSLAAIVAAAAALPTSMPAAAGASSTMVRVSALSFSVSSATATLKVCGAAEVNTRRPAAAVTSAAVAGTRAFCEKTSTNWPAVRVTSNTGGKPNCARSNSVWPAVGVTLIVVGSETSRQFTAAGAAGVGGAPAKLTVNRAMPPSATASEVAAARRNRRGAAAGR